jgi:hypothetical protein
MVASIFFEIIERQYSIRRAGFPRVSNCHCTRKGLAEYPDAPATQTMSPFQSVYSEAGLGKAYLKQMGVQPWREAQTGFDPATLGAIMSSYFGGRAEVHIRRTIVPTLYCDFASMYPTVCTLMGLWWFVIAQKALRRIFDRNSEHMDPVSTKWLRSVADVLRDYHRQPEYKFLGGGWNEEGVLSRRHVFVDTIEDIGKESDGWEEDEARTEGQDTCSPIHHLPLIGTG